MTCVGPVYTQPAYCSMPVFDDGMGNVSTRFALTVLLVQPLGVVYSGEPVFAVSTVPVNVVPQMIIVSFEWTSP